MLSERKSGLQKLRKQRGEAQRKVDAIDREIEKLGGGSGGRRGGFSAGGRARNEVSLVSAIETVPEEERTARRR